MMITGVFNRQIIMTTVALLVLMGIVGWKNNEIIISMVVVVVSVAVMVAMVIDLLLSLIEIQSMRILITTQGDGILL